MKHQGIKCGKCGDEVYSLYQHHFVHCSCGAVFADGGFAYGRFGYYPGDPYTMVRKTMCCEECDTPLTAEDPTVRWCLDCCEQHWEELTA